MRKYAPKEKQAEHNKKEKELYEAFKQLEKDLKSTYKEYAIVISQPEWDTAFKSWRRFRDTCPACNSENTSVHNYSAIWGDGDLTCDDCQTYVRMYDRD